MIELEEIKQDKVPFEGGSSAKIEPRGMQNEKLDLILKHVMDLTQKIEKMEKELFENE